MQSVLEIKPATSSHEPLGYLKNTKTDKSIDEIEILSIEQKQTLEADKGQTLSGTIENDWTSLQNWIKLTQEKIKMLLEPLFNFLSKVKFENSIFKTLLTHPLEFSINLVLYLNQINEFFKQKGIDDYSVKVVFEEDPEFPILNSITFKIKLSLPFNQILQYWEEFERGIEYLVDIFPNLQDFPIIFETQT